MSGPAHGARPGQIQGHYTRPDGSAELILVHALSADGAARGIAEGLVGAGATAVLDLTARSERTDLEARVATTGPDSTAVALAPPEAIARLLAQITGAAEGTFGSDDDGALSRILRTRDGRWVVRGFNETHHLGHRTPSPAGSTDLVVVRHGASLATPEPTTPPLDGRDDPPLSDIGNEQAALVCARLAEETYDHVVVTALRRTSETIAPLMTQTGQTPIVDPDLVEVHLGDWEGQAYRDRSAANDPVIQKVFSDERWDHIPGSEPIATFRARVAVGLQRVLDDTGPDRTALVVVHGGVVAELGRLATQCTPFALLHVANASITRMARLPGGELSLRGFNDLSHLEV